MIVDCEFAWPAWIAGVESDGAVRLVAPLEPVIAGTRLGLAFVEIKGARALGHDAFQLAVESAYGRVHAQVASSPWPHPVRYWAFVPGIHDELGSGLDRYMIFNAGRFAAFLERSGSNESAGTSAPTASGVGSPDDSFVLACLSADRPGRPVENPRQIPAYRYSRRYGPRPPCFARATLLPGAASRLLLVGGTASITGEESRHLDDLDRQIEETLRNLLAVAAAAAGESGLVAASGFRYLRVYLPARTERSRVEQRLHDAFATDVSIEWRRADLCRAELLVEIEGVAVLGSPAS